MATTYTTAPGQPRLWPRRTAGQAVAGLGVAAIAGGLTAFQNSHRALDAVAVLIVLGGSAWFATTRRVTLALAMLMVYLGLLDGYLKLATGSNLVTFVRDALLFSLALGVLLRASLQHRRLAVPPLGGWVIAFVVCVLVQVANPNGGSLYHSVAGVRQHLEFVPLFFLTFAFVRTTRALRVFVLLLVIIGTVNGLVTVVQYRESPQQLASWGPGYRERVLGTQQFSVSGRSFYSATGQEFPRPFGLGSDAGDGGLMAAFAIGGTLALASLPGTRRYLAPALLAAAVLVAGVITAQGRAVVVCAFVVALGYALLAVTSKRGFVTLAAIAATVAVAFAADQAVSGSQAPALRTANLSVTNLLQTTSQSRGFSLAKIPGYLIHHPFGAGLGVGGPAAGVSGAPADAPTLDEENEVNFLILETGIPGLVGLVGLTIAIFALGLRRCRQEPDPEARLLLAAIIAPVSGMLALYAVNSLTPTTPGGPYLWAVGGIVAYWLVVRPRELDQAARRIPNLSAA